MHALRKPPVLAGIVVAIVAIAAAVWFFFIRDTSPEAFDVGTAAGAVTTTTGAEGDDGGETDAVAFDGDPTGTWEVDQAFVGGDGEVSEAGYRVDEELSTIGDKTVVGRTSEVTGTIELDGATLTAAEFVVDMASVATDSGSRDGRYRGALEVDEFPTSTFTLTEPVDLGSVPEPGETITVDVPGEMTIHGVTNPVTLTLDAVIVDSTLVVVGSTPVVFEDYGVEKPTAAIVVSLDDEGLIEFQLFFTKVA